MGMNADSGKVEMSIVLYRKRTIVNCASCLQGQTPLFLGCSEGSIQTVRHLLVNHANRKLADNMGTTPEDIAKQRYHHDIVELLTDSSLGCNIPKVVPAPHHPLKGSNRHSPAWPLHRPLQAQAQGAQGARRKAQGARRKAQGARGKARQGQERRLLEVVMVIEKGRKQGLTKMRIQK